MKEALVSAATGALQPVLGKLAALLDDVSKLSQGVRGEVELHTRELAAIEAFVLMKSTEEDPSAQDKAWMKEVRELSYDIEDDLDEFMNPVDDKAPARPDGFMDKIKAMLDQTKAHHQIAKAIDDLKKEQVVQVAKRYKACQASSSNASNASKVDPKALTIFEDMSKLVDVDGHKEELVQLLTDCDSTQQQPNIVAVVGLGGLGKTSLTNQLYQDLKEQFECHVFISVSQNPDIIKVMRAVYSQLNEKYSPDMENLPQLINMILDFLKNKRYFIVVDDIWDVETWKAIKCAFPKISSGSKIMITTRIDDVAQSCCSSFNGHIYNIRPLSMVHLRKLFYDRLFSSQEKCPSHLEGISDQILDKCAGLPLAIIIISGVLAHRASEKELWEQVNYSIGHALRNSTIEDMVNIISLNYMDLPPHLKTCLLYLSIFPKDHAIRKDNLIRRWIGEGFIHKRDGYTLHESAEMCFNELINRSLIHPTEIDRTFGDEVKSCRLHDTVFDFIVSKAVEENFVTIIGVPGVVNPDPKGKVRRVSLQNGEIPPGLDVSRARSLHVFGSNAKIPSLLECQLLRVLDFNECLQLEDDHLAGVGNLLHLKYMRFKHAHALTKLPEQVARLQHLEIDIHGFNKVMEIPVTIQKRLTCYVTLLVDGYETVPDEVAEMQVLRVLEGLNVYTQSMQFLERLGQLKNLRKLGIIFNNYDAGDNWEEHGEEIIYSICELSKASLKSLHISMNEATDEYFEGPWFPDPSCGLRELIINGGGVTKVPAWMASLINLEKLHIPMDTIAEQDVEILGALPSLRHLCIEHDEDEELELKDAMEKAMEEHPNRPALVWKFYD